MIKREFDKAVEVADQIIDICPGDEASYARRTITSIFTRQYEQAGDSITEAINLDPINKQHSLFLMQVNYWFGNY